MSGSVLDGLHYGSFLRQDDHASAFGMQTEGKTGVPRYDGEPSKFNEYRFRVEARQRKEKALPEDELKKLGHLGLRLLDGLSGHALQLVQLMEMDKIDSKDGADYLLKQFQEKLRPRRQQQARELYEAGARVGGYLSRHPQEPMVEYILRRRAWYQQLCDLSSDLKLPDLILAEQLLDNSNISEDHKLLVRVTLQQKLTFDGVAEELVNQHGKIRERFSGGAPPRRSFGDQRGTWRSQWTASNGKGSPQKGKRHYAFFGAADHETDHRDYDYDGDYQDPPDAYGYMTQDTFAEDEYDIDFDAGCFAEEHLAYLLDQGLNDEDHEAGEYAADVIQAEEEAFWSRKGASEKGHASMKPRLSRSAAPFPWTKRRRDSSSLRLALRAAIAAMWATGRATHSKDKPRTVYFSIREAGTENPETYLAFRTPDQGQRNYRQVPPPTSLTTPSTATAAAPLPNNLVDLTDDDPYQEDRLYMNPPAATYEDHCENHGVNETALTTSTWELVPQVLSASAAQDETMARNGHHVNFKTDLLQLPPAHDHELYYLRCLLYLFLWEAASTPSPGTASTRPTCSHAKTTTVGSNQHYFIRKCVACGEVLERTKRAPTTTTSPTTPKATASSAPACSHNRVHWKGSNGYVKVRTCMDCGFRETFPNHSDGRGTPNDSDHGAARGSPSPSAPPPVLGGTLSPQEVQQIVGTFSEAVQRRLAQGGEQEIPAERLLQALRLTIEQVTLWQHGGTTSSPGPTRSPTAPPPTRIELLRQRGASSTAEAGKYKGRSYWAAFDDKNYRDWCFEYINDQSHPAMKRMVHFFREYAAAISGPQLHGDLRGRRQPQRRRPAPGPRALLGERPGGNPGHRLQPDLLRGALARALRCRGPIQPLPPLDVESRPTFRGIGGSMRTAPLLLSLRAQQVLGLVLDLNAEVAHSQLLGKDLKLVIKDGLMGLRLLPADLADNDPVEIYGAPDGENGGDGPDRDSGDRRPDHGDTEHDSDLDSENEGDTANDNHHDREGEANDEILDEGGAYLAIDALKCKVMSKGTAAKVNRDVQDVAATDRVLWNRVSRQRCRWHSVLPRGCRTFLLELFARAAVLTHAASCDYGLPVSSPINLVADAGHDIFTKLGREALEKVIDRDDPYAITCTWPSDTQLEQAEERGKFVPVMAWMQDLAKARLAKGRQKIYLDVPTDTRRNPGDSPGRTHRTAVYLTATASLKEAAGNRSHQGDCPRHVIDYFLETLDNVRVETAFPAEAESEDLLVDEDLPHHGLLDGILSEGDLAGGDRGGIEAYSEVRRGEMLDVIAEEGDNIPFASEEAEFLAEQRNEWRRLPRAQRIALRRLHTMTGHSSPAAMQRLLRTANADPQAIKALNHFHCPACASTERPKQPRVVKIPHDYSFNKDVSVDVFYVKDTRGVKYKYLSAVDNGTLFHAAWLFQDGWISWAGPPEAISLDRGTENRGKFQSMIKSHGTLLRYVGLESPFQLGRGERQGAILKDIMKRVVASRQLSGDDSMELLHHAGFTPSQWVLGRLPKEIDALTSAESDRYLGQHQEILDGESTFVLAGGSSRSFCPDRLLRPSPASRCMGHLCKGTWCASTGELDVDLTSGAARRVIGQEGRSTLWVVHGGMPMTIAMESCRRATGSEAYAKRQLELRPTRKRRREDLAEDNPDEHGYPFGDDEMAAPPGAPGAEPSGDSSNGNGQAVPSEPPVLPGPDGAEQYGNNSDGNGQAVPSEPPGLPGPFPQDVAVPSTPGGLTEDSSEPEPDHEMIPPSRRTSTTASQPAASSLQQALRRSVDGLDGVPTRKRPLSPNGAAAQEPEPRPPPPEASRSSAREDGAFHAFARRTVTKKSATARAKELNYKKATGKEKEGMDAARNKEWSNWKGFDAVDVITPDRVENFLKDHPEVDVTPMRWVDTNQAQPWEEPRDLEEGAHGARTDSPTCSALMLNFALATCAGKRWRLRGGDITASFLQGEPMERFLILRPPPGGLPDVPEGSLLVAKKPVYGTKDAPRGFWRRLHRVCLQLGLEATPLEHACYVLRREGRIAGILVSHEMQEIMGKLRDEFRFGTLDEEKEIDYCGRRIAQEPEKIYVSCPNTAAKVRSIALSSERKKQRAAAATEVEKGQLRRVLGSLNWLIVRVCRVDICYQVHRLQTVMKNACVDDLLQCNQLLNYVKATPTKGMYFPYGEVEPEKATILSVTDASHAADCDLSADGRKLGCRSQSGRLLLLVSPDYVEKGTGRVYLLGYHSNVVRRVCRSTLQAETLSLIAGYEEAEHLRAVLHYMCGGTVDGKMIAAMDSHDVVLFTDCKSLEEHAKQPGLHTVNDKRLAIDLWGIRQVIWRQRGEEVGDPFFADRPPDKGSTQIHWVDTSTMAADGQTKQTRSPQLITLMGEAKMTVSYVKLSSPKAHP
ncbi:RE1 [Symbiodinium sp. CCMP2592]|nr:RE1 [Symbiodinium sp. CCMP2592]